MGDTFGQLLGDLIHDFGVPEHFTFDNSLVQVVTKLNSNALFGNITSMVIDCHHKDQMGIQVECNP